MRALAIAAAAAILASPALLADSEVVHLFSASSAAGAVRRVVIDIPAGEVNVRNGAAGEIGVKGEIRRSYDGWRERDRQQAIADDITMEVVVRGDMAVVQRRFGPRAQSWSAKSHHSQVRAVVMVPPGVGVDVATRYGEVDLQGSFGDVNTDLTAGEIRVSTPRANVKELSATVRIGEVHTNLGPTIEDHEGVFPGGTRWRNTSGGRSSVNVHTTFGEVSVTLTE
jgi:hypothetical protein